MKNGKPRFSFENGFEITVHSDLLLAVPEEIRAEHSSLAQYLQCAVEIGIKAMAMTGIQVDRGMVKEEFAEFANTLGDVSKGLKELISQELTEEDSKLAKKLTQYLGDEGKLGRSVRQLEEQLTDPEREGSIPGSVKSLLNETFFAADSPFRKALDISDDGSPLKRFIVDQQRRVKEFQEDQVRKHNRLEESINSSFQKIFDHIGYKSDLDESESKGTRKGFVLEDECTEVLNGVSAGKDHAARVGKESVDGTRVKRGDVIVDIHQDGFDQKRIALEVKSGSYSLNGKDGVLNQLCTAMSYRDADGGIVVVTAEHAGKRQRTFDRVGNNRIIVVVDPADQQGGFLPLEVAYSVLRDELLSQEQTSDQEGPDIDAAEGTVAEIQSALKLVNSMKRNCTEAKKNVDSVRESIGTLESTIREKLAELKKQLLIS